MGPITFILIFLTVWVVQIIYHVINLGKYFGDFNYGSKPEFLFRAFFPLSFIFTSIYSAIKNFKDI